MSSQTYQLLDLLISLLAVISSAAIAIIIYLAGKKFEKQNYANELKNLWAQIDATVLTDESLLNEVDGLIHPGNKSDAIEIKKRRWLCYMLQNAIAITHNGIQKNMMPDTVEAQKSMDKTLEALVKSPEYRQVLDYCHETDLKDKCNSMGSVQK